MTTMPKASRGTSYTTSGRPHLDRYRQSETDGRVTPAAPRYGREWQSSSDLEPPLHQRDQAFRGRESSRHREPNPSPSREGHLEHDLYLDSLHSDYDQVEDLALTRRGRLSPQQQSTTEQRRPSSYDYRPMTSTSSSSARGLPPSSRSSPPQSSIDNKYANFSESILGSRTSPRTFAMDTPKRSPSALTASTFTTASTTRPTSRTLAEDISQVLGRVITDHYVTIEASLTRLLRDEVDQSAERLVRLLMKLFPTMTEETIWDVVEVNEQDMSRCTARLQEMTRGSKEDAERVEMLLELSKIFPTVDARVINDLLVDCGFDRNICAGQLHQLTT